MTEQTITIEGYFGKPKQVTRDQFTKTWRDHVGQLYNIANSDNIEAVAEMVLQADAIAQAEFDRLFAAQNKDENTPILDEIVAFCEGLEK